MLNNISFFQISNKRLDNINAENGHYDLVSRLGLLKHMYP